MIYVSNARTGEIVYSGKTMAECNKWRLTHFRRDSLNAREMPYPLKMTGDEHLAEEAIIWKNTLGNTKVKKIETARYAVTLDGVTINFSSKKEIKKTYRISDLTIKRLIFTHGQDHGISIEKMAEVHL